MIDYGLLIVVGIGRDSYTYYFVRGESQTN